MSRSHQAPDSPGLPDLTPAAAPAAPAHRVLSQARFDATVMMRNGEQLLLTLVLPALLLIGLSRISFPDLTGYPTEAPLAAGRRIDVIAPGVLALAVMSAAFTGQAIGTGFDRRNGVLRLLATTPLGRGGLLAGRVLAVLLVELIQIVVLGGLALALGWRPAATGLLWAVPVLALGTAAFVALGLLLAGLLRAETVLAAANLIWVLLVAGGGVVLPAAVLGGGRAEGLISLLPSAALGEAMRTASITGSPDLPALAVLTGWAVLATVAVSRWFRWD